ncbi:hypothetical protein pb186bvf_010534 [Paramecium bursaria]
MIQVIIQIILCSYNLKRAQNENMVIEKFIYHMFDLNLRINQYYLIIYII